MPAGHLDSDDGEHYDPARGCANSWSIPLITEIDPEYGAMLYKQYKTHFAIKRLGYGMLREWPAEVKGRSADVDSGPIIWGAGMTATGVGLAAARSQGDLQLEADIRDLSNTLGFPDTDTINGHPATGYLFGQLPIGDAFLTWGYSIERPESALQTTPPSQTRRFFQRWPWFLILFLTMGITIAQGIYFGRRSYRKYRVFLQSQEPIPNNKNQ